MMDWHSIYIVDKKIFLFENVAFSQFLTLEIADSEKLRHKNNFQIIIIWADMALWMSNFDDFDHHQISWKLALYLN